MFTYIFGKQTEYHPLLHSVDRLDQTHEGGAPGSPTQAARTQGLEPPFPAASSDEHQQEGGNSELQLKLRPLCNAGVLQRLNRSFPLHFSINFLKYSFKIIVFRKNYFQQLSLTK